MAKMLERMKVCKKAVLQWFHVNPAVSKKNGKYFIQQINIIIFAK